MEVLIKKIQNAVRDVCIGSKFYRHTIWPHALGVAKSAKDFAETLGADLFVAQVGGLLHDIGAAKFGKDDHHITGVQLASPILLQCACPLEFIGVILSCIYSHRGSQNIPFQTQEAMCVAAADAKDHFDYVDELWLSHMRDLNTPTLFIFQELSGKLERDWKKTDPQIKVMLDGIYDRAKQRLVGIADGCIKPRERFYE